MESSDAEVATHPHVKRLAFQVDYPEGGAMRGRAPGIEVHVQPHHRTKRGSNDGFR
jgi:hypothetical protein